MPIQHGIWKVGDKPMLLETSKLASEQKLEEMIVNDLRILSSEWMLIGRQESNEEVVLLLERITPVPGSTVPFAR